jgi:hypothetical protein
MDSESELARAKWLLIFIALFFISGCMSWGEMMYLIVGKDAEARIAKVYESTRRGRFGLARGTYLTVEYSFMESDGTQRTGMDSVALDWPVPESGKVRVRYRAGADGESRLAGHVNWGALALFGVSFGFVGFFAFRLWREASDATRERPRKKLT